MHDTLQNQDNLLILPLQLFFSSSGASRREKRYFSRVNS